MTTARAITISRLLNLVALLGLLLVLSGSLYLQFAIGEQPCPLCLVQRSGMIGLAVGPLLNLFTGIKSRNYAFSILAAFVGGAGSVRQILLHIAGPQDPGYGPQVLGLHLYTWAAITFGVGVVGCAILLMWEAPLMSADKGVLGEAGWMRVASIAVFCWVSAYLLVIAFSILPECGDGLCPDDPGPIPGIAPGAFAILLLAAIAVSLAIGVLLDRRLSRRPTA